MRTRETISAFSSRSLAMVAFVLTSAAACAGSPPDGPEEPTVRVSVPTEGFQATHTSAPLTPSWTVYVNDFYRYGFDYPPGTVLEVMDKDAGTVSVDTGSGDPFFVDARMDYLPGDVTIFLDTASIGQRSIGRIVWLEFALPEGYCDGPGCSPPIYALRMEYPGVLYTVTFYSQSTTTELQESILATFRILD